LYVFLSDKTISKLISATYEDIGVKGEDYIRKIIQIPINLPQWKGENIKEGLLPKISEKT